MPTPDELRAQLGALDDARAKSEQARDGARARAASAGRKLDALARMGRASADHADGADAIEVRRQAEAEISRESGKLAQIEKDRDGLLRALVELLPPRDQVATMTDTVPFVLLPVRVEARFRPKTTGGTELCVRIYPDSIAIESHEPALTDEERQAGTAYWEAVWRAGPDEDAARAAWRALVTFAGPPRAAWIAKALEPAGRVPDVTTPADAALNPAPVFPSPPSRASSWSRAPRTRVMPDRFVVIAYFGQGTREIIGEPIPDPLIVGPDPSSDTDYTDDNGRLTTDDAMRWMHDFDRAVKIGMGVRFDLNASEANAGFERILVLGVRGSSDAADARARLEALLDGHHFAAGLAIVPQGTPTNNTDAVSSGASNREREDDATFDAERGAALFADSNDPLERRDGQRLANALGVSSPVLHHVRGADGTDWREALAMQRALWPATLGWFMEEAMDPVFSAPTIDRTRVYFTRHVLGRGAVPAFRVGMQPYGVLVTSALSTWALDKDATPFEKNLLDVLNRVKGMWDFLSSQVSQVSMTGDQAPILLDILGLHPTSVEYYRRLAATPDLLWNLINFNGLSGEALAWNSELMEASARLLSALGYGLGDTPKIAQLILLANQLQLDGPLIDDAPLSESAPIAPMPNVGNYIEWLANSATTLDRLRVQDFGLDEQGRHRAPPKALLYLLLRQALLHEQWSTGMTVLERAGITTASDRRERPFYNMGAEPDYTRWDHLATHVPGVTGGRGVGEWLATPDAAALPEGVTLRELRAVLPILAPLPTARLERLLAEHLDTCSYRLDSWLLGLTSERLDAMRASGGKLGLFLGAYGWLEKVQPRIRQPDPVPADEIPDDAPPGAPLVYAPDSGGYVHAPSLNHAVTASVLRSCYLTHADQAHPDRMAVNLTSSRVRRALSYFEGIRNGQDLAALLGYRFERALHDRNASLQLDEYIVDLRQAFPLSAGSVTPAPTGAPVEALEASNVVDGLKLLAAARNTAYPYGVTSLPSSGSAEGTAIAEEVAHLEDDLDAIGDLSLAESVQQTVQANYERANAALKAVSVGDRAPDAEVVSTPRRGRAIRHRVVIAFDDGAPAGNPWTGVAMTPRATAEPRLNNWLGVMLGAPDDIRCRVTYTPPGDLPDVTTEVSLADLELQPIDTLYCMGRDVAAGAAELLRRIERRARIDEGLTDDVELRVELVARDPAWSIGVKTFVEMLPLVNGLRDVLSNSRPLGADDLRLPFDATAADNPGNVNAAEAVTRATNARDALDTARQTLVDKRQAAVNRNPVGSLEVDALRDALLALSLFGVADAIPVSISGVSDDIRDLLVAQADRTIERARKAVADADIALARAGAANASAKAQADAARDAARAAFGGAFNLLTRFTATNATEIGLSLGDRAALLANAPTLALDEWLESCARVRTPVMTLHRCAMLADAFERPVPQLSVAQIPFTSGERWVGLPLVGGKRPVSDIVSLVLLVRQGYQAGTVQSGLVIDEWSEVIPDPNVTTGIAFHFDRPNSEPPQAVLVVVPPERRGTWRWDDLVQTLRDTLDLARLRGVEPDQIDRTAYAQLLPAIMSPVSAQPVTTSVDFGRVRKDDTPILYFG